MTSLCLVDIVQTFSFIFLINVYKYLSKHRFSIDMFFRTESNEDVLDSLVQNLQYFLLNISSFSLHYWLNIVVYFAPNPSQRPILDLKAVFDLVVLFIQIFFKISLQLPLGLLLIFKAEIAFPFSNCVNHQVVFHELYVKISECLTLEQPASKKLFAFIQFRLELSLLDPIKVADSRLVSSYAKIEGSSLFFLSFFLLRVLRSDLLQHLAIVIYKQVLEMYLISLFFKIFLHKFSIYSLFLLHLLQPMFFFSLFKGK